MKNPVFSIIIPNFETPELLVRCLDSIPVRDDLEIIVVDDLSSDATRQAIEPAIRKRGAKFILKTRRTGGGASRNEGMRQARGRYLIFADSDDHFTDAFAPILDDCRDSQADIIYFGAEGVGIHSDGYDITPILNAQLESGNTKWLRFLFGQPWCKIVSRRLIEENSIWFDEIWRSNDTTFSYMTGFHAKEILTDTRKGYAHIARKDSTSDIVDDSVLLDCLEVFARKNSFLKKHGIALFDSTFNAFCHNIRKRKDNLLRAKAIIRAAKYGFGWTAFSYFVLKKYKGGSPYADYSVKE